MEEHLNYDRSHAAFKYTNGYAVEPAELFLLDVVDKSQTAHPPCDDCYVDYFGLDSKGNVVQLKGPLCRMKCAPFLDTALTYHTNRTSVNLRKFHFKVCEITASPFRLGGPFSSPLYQSVTPFSADVGLTASIVLNAQPLQAAHSPAQKVKDLRNCLAHTSTYRANDAFVLQVVNTCKQLVQQLPCRDQNKLQELLSLLSSIPTMTRPEIDQLFDETTPVLPVNSTAVIAVPWTTSSTSQTTTGPPQSAQSSTAGQTVNSSTTSQQLSQKRKSDDDDDTGPKKKFASGFLRKCVKAVANLIRWPKR